VNQKSGVVSAFAAKVNFSAFPQQVTLLLWVRKGVALAFL
jgi:hypothetical protein